MNLLFLTLLDFSDINKPGIYADLLREFTKRGDNVYVISPAERRQKGKTRLLGTEQSHILKVRIGNITKSNLIEKGISTLLIEYQIKRAIKKYFSDTHFDMVMYSTPPITLVKTIQYIKQRDHAKSYLLLKDIFPQNAVDLGMFSKKSIFYRFFRAKEKRLYALSDSIGCMSQANVDFVINHNTDIDKDKVHISPNSIQVITKTKGIEKKTELRNKYHIPLNGKVFVYGGNLGKPQDIPFVIKCLKANESKDDRFFVICGTGTEYSKLKNYVENCNPKNVLLINGLPKEEYEELILSCDVGLIFLDHRFTIPNFPSRLLSYLQNSMPVIACTDVHTDIGKIIEQGDFGWWCESNNVNGFVNVIDQACQQDCEQKGANAKKYLTDHYTVGKSYEIIIGRSK